SIIIQLNYKLKTGDIVDIITSSSSSVPSRDWLKFVNTSKAKNKIRRYFKAQDQEVAVESGEKIVADLILELELDPKNFMTDEIMDEHAQKFNYKDSESLYAAIGFN